MLPYRASLFGELKRTEEGMWVQELKAVISIDMAVEGGPSSRDWGHVHTEAMIEYREEGRDNTIKLDASFQLEKTGEPSLLDYLPRCGHLTCQLTMRLPHPGGSLLDAVVRHGLLVQGLISWLSRRTGTYVPVSYTETVEKRQGDWRWAGLKQELQKLVPHATVARVSPLPGHRASRESATIGILLAPRIEYVAWMIPWAEQALSRVAGILDHLMNTGFPGTPPETLPPPARVRIGEYYTVPIIIHATYVKWAREPEDIARDIAQTLTLKTRGAGPHPLGGGVATPAPG